MSLTPVRAAFWGWGAAPLRHAGSPDGACPSENENGACVHLQLRVVYAPGEVVVAVEDHGRSCMPEQPSVCGGVLYDAAVRGQIAAQHGESALVLQGSSSGLMTSSL